ncbi:MAG: FkbM family methyltransferase [Acidiferrobacterales bacterium]
MKQQHSGSHCRLESLLTMHLVSLHRAVYRVVPQSVRARLKDSIPFGVQRFPLFLPDGQVLLLDHLDASKILRRFAWKGIYGYEPDTIRLFYALAKRAKGVLDIGAYFGLYALVAAKANPQASIHAFEPLPQNLVLLRHFLELNRCEHVLVHPVAVAREVGEAILYIPKERRSALPATGSLKNRFRAGERFEGLNAQTAQVRTAPLDTLVKDAGIETVDLMKIDTEETEHQVIQSGLTILERFRPDLVMEITFRDPHVSGALAVLRDLNYLFFRIGPKGLTRFDEGDLANDKRTAAMNDLFHCEILCTCRSDSELPSYS